MAPSTSTKSTQIAIAPADAIAYVDEAGAKGRSRNLLPSRDDEIALVAAVVVHITKDASVRQEMTPWFEKFLRATPPDKKPHFADAFAPGQEAWAEVAREVRSRFFMIARENRLAVVYHARRLRLEREARDEAARVVEAAQEGQRSRVEVNIPSGSPRVEDELLSGLALKLDAFAEDSSTRRIDLLCDNLDKGVARAYRRAIDETRSMSCSSRQATEFDRATNTVQRSRLDITFSAGFELDTQFLGDLGVAGKSEPFVLLADSIANSLHGHLRTLPVDARLNAPSSISDWPLARNVYGVREDANEDDF